ncbi:actin-binding IPP [Paramuricea clavata]|nr:actin-binding IPP [Paramuricea clavata]
MEIKQDDIKKSQSEMKVQNEEIERKQDEIKKNNDEIKHSQAQMKVELNEIKEKITGLERKQEKIKDEMKVELKEMKDKITGMERKQDRTKQSVDDMNQQFEKMMIMVQQALQESNVTNNGAQAMDPAVPANNQDIIILGGRYGPKMENISKTVEKYSIIEGKSTQLPGMNLTRTASASCVYNGDVIVAGGYDDQAGIDLIEILKMKQHPLRWTMFDGKLPVKLHGHDVTVYQDKLYIIGGDNWNERKISDVIYELSLAPPYTVKVIARMPQPRQHHGAEIVNGKLFILGGTTTRQNKDATNSVVVYDFIKNEIKPCASLPKPVSGMSTVAWGNTIIVVGGVDKNDQILNDVIMYHIESGRSERLPSLKHKRRGASAVIMHDVIVVLGGWNKEERLLNSVESFTMGDDQWKEMPGMKEKRVLANAVVKPRN